MTNQFAVIRDENENFIRPVELFPTTDEHPAHCIDFETGEITLQSDAVLLFSSVHKGAVEYRFEEMEAAS